jgi:hypothetical protein
MKGAQGQQRRKIIHLLPENHLPTAGKLSTRCWQITYPLLLYFQPAAENSLTATENFFTNTRNFPGAVRFCAGRRVPFQQARRLLRSSAFLTHFSSQPVVSTIGHRLAHLSPFDVY